MPTVCEVCQAPSLVLGYSHEEHRENPWPAEPSFQWAKCRSKATADWPYRSQGKKGQGTGSALLAPPPALPTQTYPTLDPHNLSEWLQLGGLGCAERMESCIQKRARNSGVIRVLLSLVVKRAWKQQNAFWLLLFWNFHFFVITVKPSEVLPSDVCPSLFSRHILADSSAAAGFNPPSSSPSGGAGLSQIQFSDYSWPKEQLASCFTKCLFQGWLRPSYLYRRKIILLV